MLLTYLGKLRKNNCRQVFKLSLTDLSITFSEEDFQDNTDDELTTII